MKRKLMLFVVMFLAMLFIGCNFGKSKEYNVRYEENGGSLVEDYIALEGETIKLPSIAKEGYTFIGWYLDSSFTKRADNEVVNGNITLYAKWEEKETEGLEYELNKEETGYIVSRYKGSNTKVVIASTYKGLPVVGIGDRAFSLCQRLKSIVIPNSVESIGDLAFSVCRSLESIEIPNSVTSIGDNAFAYCTLLESITIPNSVESIGEGIFSDCRSLIIYCETASQPSGWASSWNSGRPAYWNATKNDITQVCHLGI